MFVPRCVFCVWWGFLLVSLGWGYKVPEVTIKVLKPKGFTASIPDEPGIGLFSFNANRNSPISPPEVGEASGEVLRPAGGRWTYRNSDWVLGTSDAVHYWVTVAKGGESHVEEGTFRILDTKPTDTKTKPSPSSNPRPPACVPSLTTVRGKPACSGRVIFSDDFHKLADKWLVQQYIPNKHPDYPFVSYQNLPHVVNVTSNKLQITPVTLLSLPGQNDVTSGSLNLYSGCTENGEACSMIASGPDILPPVVSGRVTTRDSFSFRYGTVTVRAKLLLGDWFYPEILLEPTAYKYGTDYSSGTILIATSLGNPDLKIGDTQVGITRLLGGAVVDRFRCHDRMLFTKYGQPWSDQFHEYEVRWTPDGIRWLVDGVEYGRLFPPNGGFAESLRDCSSMRTVFQRWSSGTNMAPFDQEFHLTLGVAAGGVTMFSDDATDARGRKSWRNLSSKAKLNYWQHLNNCQNCHLLYQALLVDRVTVTAL